MAISLELQADASSTGHAANNITFPKQAGLTFYLTKFTVVANGATTPAIVSITLTGAKSRSGTTPTWPFNVAAAGTYTILQEVFGEKGWPGTAQNTDFILNVPDFGVGNTVASVIATGFYA